MTPLFWAQLLDAAARLCPVSEETRSWFSRLTNSSGVDDARTIVTNAEILQGALRENKEAIRIFVKIFDVTFFVV